jgi:hypothetical protein
MSIIWAPKWFQMDTISTTKLWISTSRRGPSELIWNVMIFENMLPREKKYRILYLNIVPISWASVWFQVEKFQLQSCKSRWKLQLLCNFYLYPSWYKRILFFYDMLSREENCVSIISETKGFKNLNYKIVNLDKNCNFRINFISIQVHYLRATFFFWRGGSPPPMVLKTATVAVFKTRQNRSGLPRFSSGLPSRPV